jgi:hypothetical protein
MSQIWTLQLLLVSMSLPQQGHSFAKEDPSFSASYKYFNLR